MSPRPPKRQPMKPMPPVRKRPRTMWRLPLRGQGVKGGRRLRESKQPGPYPFYTLVQFQAAIRQEARARVRQHIKLLRGQGVKGARRLRRLKQTNSLYKELAK